MKEIRKLKTQSEKVENSLKEQERLLKKEFKGKRTWIKQRETISASIRMR